MKGTVFNIQKFSINDGPGIRTTVFLKGCPLSCLWCHNPESKLIQREVFYDASKCIMCGRCAAVCKRGAHVFDAGSHLFDREKCTVCGKCAEVCPTKSIEIVGEEKTVDEVMREVMKDKIFYESSGGGMTVSGGEPMLQFDFTYELLKAAKSEGVHTCIETCGYADAEKYKKIAKYVDIFLYDFKETDPERHRKYTGVSNAKILENLSMLDKMGAKTVLRCPIIPTINDREEHFRAIGELASSLKNVLEINVEPYHPLGAGKSERLGKDYPLRELTFPEEETVEEWMNKIRAHTKTEVKKA